MGQPLIVLALCALVLPSSLGGSTDSVAKESDAREPGGEAAGDGLTRFPRFFNAKTMRVVKKDDSISYGYAAFIPAARPTYDARMDASLPLARRINAGYQLPNVFRPGEWAPLRPFVTAPKQEEDANGQLQSTRAYCQPMSWYNVLTAFFGTPNLPTRPLSLCSCPQQGDHSHHQLRTLWRREIGNTLILPATLALAARFFT